MGKASRQEKSIRRIWASRNEAYLDSYERHTDRVIYFTHEKIPREKLLETLVPDYRVIGGFQDLTEKQQIQVKAGFIKVQLASWDKKRKEKKSTDDGDSSDSGFQIQQWEVYRDIADHDRLVTIWRGPNHDEAVVEFDARNIVAEKQRINDGPYTPYLALFEYHPWKKFRGEKVIARQRGPSGRMVEQKIPRINPFQKAPWLKEGILPESEAIMPPLFERYFDHFFADDVSRDSTFAWMRRMVFGDNLHPNQTALVLNGAKAIGKNAFGVICKGLVGSTNFKIGKRSIMSSDFNLDLKDCLCYLLDEIVIKTNEQLNKFRAYCNEELQLEGKGIESSKFMTFKSFILNNNGTSDIILSWDDRRYSVPDLTRTMLKRGMGLEASQDFWQMVEDIDGEHYRQLGSWLYHNADIDTYPNDYAHKGDRFAQMVLAGLTPWQSQLRKEALDWMKDNEDIYRDKGVLLDDLRGSLKPEEWPQDIATFQTFLDSYLEQDRRLGVLKVVRDERDGRMEPTVFHPDIDESESVLEGL